MSRYHVNHTTKIAQLADQAHEESNTVYNKRLETERADSVIFFDIFNQKFAELIVRECIAINKVETTALDLPEYNLGMLEGYRRARENISIHFGVE